MIRRAQAVHPISDLQIEYSLSCPPEARIFPLLAHLGIGMTAYGVAPRGLLSDDCLGPRKRPTHRAGDWRAKARPARRIASCTGLELSAADVARLEETVPASAVAGTRYDEHQMRILDSER